MSLQQRLISNEEWALIKQVRSMKGAKHIGDEWISEQEFTSRHPRIKTARQLEYFREQHPTLWKGRAHKTPGGILQYRDRHYNWTAVIDMMETPLENAKKH